MNVRNLLDIHSCYQQKGGEFWVALSDGKVIGTIGLLLREQNCAIMKKFFVKREFRSQKIGLALYQELLQFAKAAGSIFLSGQEKILCSENTRYISLAVYTNFGILPVHQPDLRHHLYLSGSGTADQYGNPAITKKVQFNASMIWLLSLLLIYPFLLLITSPLKRLSLQMAKTGEAGKSVNCPTVLIPW